MSRIIDGNGDFTLIATSNGRTPSPESKVHIPAAIGGAVITIGWIDSTDTFNAYIDGAMLAGESQVFSSGSGIKLAAQITGWTVSFIIEVGI